MRWFGQLVNQWSWCEMEFHFTAQGSPSWIRVPEAPVGTFALVLACDLTFP